MHWPHPPCPPPHPQVVQEESKEIKKNAVSTKIKILFYDTDTEKLNETWKKDRYVYVCWLNLQKVA